MIYICKIYTPSEIISCIALLISLISVYYVWKKDRKEKHLETLRQDKSILYPLLHENYEYFLQISNKFDADKIGHILYLLKIERLHNKSIQERINKLKGEELNFLVDDQDVESTNSDLEELFIEIRYYLSEVI